MTYWPDDNEEEEPVKAPDNIPVEAVECEHRLIHKLEQHAIALFQAAVEDRSTHLTISREGMVEISTAILQLISIIRTRKYVS